MIKASLYDCTFCGEEFRIEQDANQSACAYAAIPKRDLHDDRIVVGVFFYCPEGHLEGDGWVKMDTSVNINGMYLAPVCGECKRAMREAIAARVADLCCNQGTDGEGEPS